MRDAVLIPDLWAQAAAGGDVETVFLRPRPDFRCRDGSGFGWARWRWGGHLGAGEQRDLTNHRIGEADPLVGGKPLPVHAGQHGHSSVSVVVYLDRRFPRQTTHDPADVLRDDRLRGGRRAQEKRVERWAVEAFANIAGGCRQQHWLVRVHRIPVCELLQDDTPLSRGYGAVQHHRRQATGVEFGGELVDVLGPSCHHQAVTAASDRVHHVIDDLRGADPVRHECRDDDRLKDAGRVAVDVVTDRGGSRMNMQFLDEVRRTRDLVSYLSAVHEHDVLPAIRPLRRRGEPEPAPCGYRLDRLRERVRRDVVAFIYDDQAVLRKDRCWVICPSQ